MHFLGWVRSRFNISTEEARYTRPIFSQHYSQLCGVHSQVGSLRGRRASGARSSGVDCCCGPAKGPAVLAVPGTKVPMFGGTGAIGEKEPWLFWLLQSDTFVGEIARFGGITKETCPVGKTV